MVLCTTEKITDLRKYQDILNREAFGSYLSSHQTRKNCIVIAESRMKEKQLASHIIQRQYRDTTLCEPKCNQANHSLQSTSLAFKAALGPKNGG